MRCASVTRSDAEGFAFLGVAPPHRRRSAHRAPPAQRWMTARKNRRPSRSSSRLPLPWNLWPESIAFEISRELVLCRIKSCQSDAGINGFERAVEINHVVGCRVLHSSATGPAQPQSFVSPPRARSNSPSKRIKVCQDSYPNHAINGVEPIAYLSVNART